jgi:hypothetical protein
MRPEAGFTSVGERLVLTRDDDGAITSVRIGGMTSWPDATFLAQRPALLAEGAVS